MSSKSLILSVNPLATIRALTSLPFCRKTHHESMMLFLCCCGASLTSTSLKTPCFFIDSASFFMPCFICSLSRPSVSQTCGSNSIFSFSISSLSSFDAVVIFSPFFVVIVTASTLSLVAFGSCALSLALGSCCVLACFDSASPVASSCALFVGDAFAGGGRNGIGSACRGTVGGDVAIGEVAAVLWCVGTTGCEPIA